MKYFCFLNLRTLLKILIALVRKKMTAIFGRSGNEVLFQTSASVTVLITGFEYNKFFR
jgi:hypothetical protein